MLKEEKMKIIEWIQVMQKARRAFFVCQSEKSSLIDFLLTETEKLFIALLGQIRDYANSHKVQAPKAFQDF